jgi:hypothetical protein
MTTREKRKLIRAKIEAGASPQQVYDELHGPGNAADEKLADLVRFVPTPARRIQYRTAQWVLLVLLVLSALHWLVLAVAAAQVNAAAMFMAAAWMAGYAVIIVAITAYWRKAHAWAGMISIWGFFRLRDAENLQSLLPLVLMGASAVLAIYLQRKLTPDYIKLKEKYTNSEGQERLREMVRFGD